MNIVNIKNKSFVGLRIAGTVTTIIAYCMLLAYFVYVGITALQNNGMWAWMFLLFSFLGAFGFVVEMNLLWGKIKGKDGAVEEIKKGVFIATIVLNAFILFLSVMFWIAELSL